MRPANKIPGPATTKWVILSNYPSSQSHGWIFKVRWKYEAHIPCRTEHRKLLKWTKVHTRVKKINPTPVWNNVHCICFVLFFSPVCSREVTQSQTTVHSLHSVCIASGRRHMSWCWSWRNYRAKKKGKRVKTVLLAEGERSWTWNSHRI